MLLMLATARNAVADLNESSVFPLSAPTYLNFSELAATNLR